VCPFTPAGPPPDDHRIAGRTGLLLRPARAMAARIEREHQWATTSPRASDLSVHPPQHLLAVENEFNNRPRHILNDRTPGELFSALLASENPPVLRR
jgi:hypothetical protein